MRLPKLQDAYSPSLGEELVGVSHSFGSVVALHFFPSSRPAFVECEQAVVGSQDSMPFCTLYHCVQGPADA